MDARAGDGDRRDGRVVRGRRARAVQACDGGTGSSGAELDARTGSVLSLRFDGEA